MERAVGCCETAAKTLRTRLGVALLKERSGRQRRNRTVKSGGYKAAARPVSEKVCAVFRRKLEWYRVR